METESPKWATEPREILVDNIERLKPGSVLDLGGSDGVNDVFLAERGFKVTNVDKDAEALGTLQAVASARGLDITTDTKDLSNYSIGQPYDNVVSFYTLHFLSRENAGRLLQEMRDNTTQGGVNVIVTFTNQGEFDMNPDNFYPSSEELVGMYKDSGWEILLESEEMGSTRSGKQQGRINLIARKN